MENQLAYARQQLAERDAELAAVRAERDALLAEVTMFHEMLSDYSKMQYDRANRQKGI